MIKTQVLAWLLSVGGLLQSVAGMSQQPDPDVPLHARTAPGGQGWVCVTGFRQVGRQCVANRHGLPSKRMFEVFSGGWRCARGYRLSDRYCVPVTIPRHALPGGDGSQWKCESGFRREGSYCEIVIVPPHAHLDETGEHWECDRDFRPIARVCIPASGAQMSGQMSGDRARLPAEHP